MDENEKYLLIIFLVSFALAFLLFYFVNKTGLVESLFCWCVIGFCAIIVFVQIMPSPEAKEFAKVMELS